MITDVRPCTLSVPFKADIANRAQHCSHTHWQSTQVALLTQTHSQSGIMTPTPRVSMVNSVEHGCCSKGPFLPHCGAGTSHVIFCSPRTGITLLAPMLLRPSDLEWITSPAVLNLQLAGSRLWDFSAHIITWANSTYQIFLLIVNLRGS